MHQVKLGAVQEKVLIVFFVHATNTEGSQTVEVESRFMLI